MWNDIYERAFQDQQDIRINVREVKQQIKKLHSTIEYFIINDIVIGFAILFPLYKLSTKKIIWHLDYFAIDPNHQKSGFGSMFLKQLIFKYKYLSIECKEKLINYYKRVGFYEYNINYNLAITNTRLHIMITIPKLKHINRLIILLNNINSFDSNITNKYTDITSISTIKLYHFKESLLQRLYYKTYLS